MLSLVKINLKLEVIDMKMVKKLTASVSLALTLGVANMCAATYIVEPGDTLYNIVYNKLGFNSFEEARIKIE